ncbi:hypothetical protein [Candidatus Nitrospira bockiana]
MLRTFSAIILSVMLTGCAGLSKEQYVVCPYDMVWQAALDTMKDRPLAVKDKERGVIESGWTEMAAPERGFGVFRRNAFDDKERARMIVTLKRLNDVTEVNVTENRERWHLKGGVSSGATRWWPIEPSEQAMASVMGRINSKLKDQGCSHAQSA